MSARRKSTLKPRKLSAAQAKRLARSLQAAVSKRRAKSLKPLSLRSTATGKGTVVFRAARVLRSFARAAQS